MYTNVPCYKIKHIQNPKTNPSKYPNDTWAKAHYDVTISIDYNPFQSPFSNVVEN